MKRGVSGMLLIFLFMVMLLSVIDIKPAKSAWTGTVYIRADGSIEPPDAPITTPDNVTYTLIGNITSSGDGIIIERDNIKINGAGCTIQGSGYKYVDYAGIRLEGRYNVSIENINIKEFYYGILLKSFSCKIYRNNITINTFGILIWPGVLNEIVENNVIGNVLGIGLYFGANNNSITKNNIMLNLGSGGIGIVKSTNNTIYHNNFIGNEPKNVYIEPPQPGEAPSVNVWDNGYPSGGNYWSDYVDVDLYSGPYQNETSGDGIGDTPYIIDANNRDNYPLMTPRGVLPITAVYINADGSISPPYAPIFTTDNVTYTLANNIYGCIVVERDNIVIDGAGYTLQNPEGAQVKVGIQLSERKNVTIKNIEVEGYPYGIRFSNSSKNSILNSSIINNGIGIYLDDSSSNNIIAGNTIKANKDKGVYIWDSSYNRIHGNNITSNKGGIRLGFSNYNNICRNDITQNEYGIEFYGSSNNNVNENNIRLNRVEGAAIPGGDGILLWSGIDRSYPKPRLINSNNNIIVRNNLTANSYAGLRCIAGNNNIISENNIKNNSFGIFLSSCFNNIIFHNNFFNNTNQVYSSDSVNVWDNGYPSGGNYWSDYTGVDLFSGPYQNITGSDSIGDAPYIIDENNVDCYPLMKPWMPITLPGDLNHDGRIDILDVVLVASIYGCSEGEPNWNPDADLAAPYGKIDILDLVTIAANYGKTHP